MEKNDIKVGDWTVDLFICDDGNLGITVYEKGTDGNKGDEKFVDIYVDSDTLKVTSG